MLRQALACIPFALVTLVGCVEEDDFELFPTTGPIADIEDDGTNLVVRTCKEAGGLFGCAFGDETVELVADGTRSAVPKPAPEPLDLFPEFTHEVTVASPSDLTIQLSMVDGVDVHLEAELPARFAASAPDAFVRSVKPLRVAVEHIADHDAWIRVTSRCGSFVDVRDVASGDAQTEITLGDLPAETCTHLVQAVQERTVDTAMQVTLRRVVRMVVVSDP